jgi:hypothetical protein
MKNTIIKINRIQLGDEYIQKKHGLLNALTFASAEYIYKVINRDKRKGSKKFNPTKLGLLQRTIIHKNPHLDEYFAELFFRAILPPNMKDIELAEHTLMSSEQDTLAKVIWPNSVVFGFNKEEQGDATALELFDEHEKDGSRNIHSCSQIIIDKYLIKPIPKSIQFVLDEVNQIDSSGGAHSYNLANLIKKIHDIPLIVGFDEIENNYIKKNLTENWKRAIVSACITAMIYTYENNLLSYEISENETQKIEGFVKRSFDYFISKTFINQYYEEFYKLKGKAKRNFYPGNKTLLKTKKWITENQVVEQNLVLHKLAYALDRCWGLEISKFIMMHLWQAEFQFQMAFAKIDQQIKDLKYPNKETPTEFGVIQIIEIENVSFIPIQKEDDKVKKNFKIGQPFRILYGTISNPQYPNLASVLKKILNTKYHGFGLILLKDKIINSTMVSNGTTTPYLFWEYISNEIQKTEPKRWFQLNNNDTYADFILNRTKSHQEHLPTEKIDLKFLSDLVKKYT